MLFTASVVTGQGRGKKLGIPTLNLDLSTVPKQMEHGIYAAWATIDERKMRAAVHYGPRPVFMDDVALEAHIIDATIEAAPMELTLEIVQKIRGVKNFKSPEVLKAAIAQDIEKVRKILQ